LVDRREQAKLQWLQDPSEVNEDNLSNVRREASRRFRNKKREYLKGKINELESNSKNKGIRDLYRGITEFKKGYQPKTKLAEDEKSDVLADPDKIVNGLLLSSNECPAGEGCYADRDTDSRTICARA
jgi:hypothetical protein